MDLCNLYDFYTSVFTLAFTPCTFNVLFYVRIKYYNNNRGFERLMQHMSYNTSTHQVGISGNL